MLNIYDSRLGHFRCSSEQIQSLLTHLTPQENLIRLSLEPPTLRDCRKGRNRPKISPIILWCVPSIRIQWPVVNYSLCILSICALFLKLAYIHASDGCLTCATSVFSASHWSPRLSVHFLVFNPVP